MLIAHEMSKEIETKPKPPSVVAKLMGLDTLPATTYPQNRCSGMPIQQENCKDVYEVMPQQRLSSERRMDLVRQKFMEAKRLATDQRLLQSKEFQEALEVLSSNRDLFLKFLEEPNSLFSQNLAVAEAAVVPPPPPLPPKRITVLKPLKSVDICKKASFVAPQPTRIVVLKPSTKIAQESDNSPTGFSDSKRDNLEGSRDVAREITRQIRESLSENRRDDHLLSSILSNGYIGDESSFNRSENGFLEDDPGNLSDSELVSPTSRFSWDHGNRFGSPLSLSSHSRASHSPESSVIREAKKRLSERWAIVASGGNNRDQQQRQVHRSSSTLGEMLSIPEKKEEVDDAEFGFASSSRDPSDLPVKLLRSKSVPSSSSCSRAEESISSKDHDRPKSGRAFFKGKMSSFFFYKSKKLVKEKEDPSRNAKSVIPDDHNPREDYNGRGERGAASISKVGFYRKCILLLPFSKSRFFVLSPAQCLFWRWRLMKS